MKQDQNSISIEAVTMNKMHANHILIWFIYSKNNNQDTDGYENQYRCALDIYLMTVLSSLYDMIRDIANIVPGYGKNYVYFINATYNVIWRKK